MIGPPNFFKTITVRACEQALHLEESPEVTREADAQGKPVRGTGKENSHHGTRSRVLSWPPLLAVIRDLARRL